LPHLKEAWGALCARRLLGCGLNGPLPRGDPSCSDPAPIPASRAAHLDAVSPPPADLQPEHRGQVDLRALRQHEHDHVAGLGSAGNPHPSSPEGRRVEQHENVDEFAKDRGTRYLSLRWAYDQNL
jgi:hypothetical protein